MLSDTELSSTGCVRRFITAIADDSPAIGEVAGDAGETGDGMAMVISATTDVTGNSVGDSAGNFARTSAIAARLSPRVHGDHESCCPQTPQASKYSGWTSDRSWRPG